MPYHCWRWGTPDEVICAAGLQFLVFKSVIGTLLVVHWSMTPLQNMWSKLSTEICSQLRAKLIKFWWRA
ncbi:hypothetical protein BDR04DRAFT_1100617 [Suillus decipiens]|nr:hypothetical protein BDR04DRAFT_1100617 [Suillus decipiens]